MANTTAVLIFGALVIAAEAGIMIVRGHSWGPHSVRIVGLSLIIVMTVFLAVSSAERAGAAYALLGVFAGYLVGQYGAASAPAKPSDGD
jgi:heme/copper-type cytochrome/quinol oxidase subunit 3